MTPKTITAIVFKLAGLYFLANALLRLPKLFDTSYEYEFHLPIIRVIVMVAIGVILFLLFWLLGNKVLDKIPAEPKLERWNVKELELVGIQLLGILLFVPNALRLLGQLWLLLPRPNSVNNYNLFLISPIISTGATTLLSSFMIFKPDFLSKLTRKFRKSENHSQT